MYITNYFLYPCVVCLFLASCDVGSYIYEFDYLTIEEKNRYPKPIYKKIAVSRSKTFGPGTHESLVLFEGVSSWNNEFQPIWKDCKQVESDRVNKSISLEHLTFVKVFTYAVQKARYLYATTTDEKAILMIVMADDDYDLLDNGYFNRDVELKKICREKYR